MKIIRIKKLTIGQTGKFMAAFYGLITIAILPFMLLVAVGSGDFPRWIPLMLLTLIYPILGYIVGILSAFIFNIAAKLSGGLEVHSENHD